MDTQQAYDNWSGQYDSNQNKTRDLEAIALRSALKNIKINHCLELGCGTGKNSIWLSEKATALTAVDFSEGMLEIARQKVTSADTTFIAADLNKDWDFIQGKYECIMFSLVLEHFSELQPLLKKAAAALSPSGYLYIGELHPFKQYGGSKARFETATGTEVVECFNHHVSDFTNAATAAGFCLIELQEYFDENDRNTVPRILAMLFRMNA